MLAAVRVGAAAGFGAIVGAVLGRDAFAVGFCATAAVLAVLAFAEPLR